MSFHNRCFIITRSWTAYALAYLKSLMAMLGTARKKEKKRNAPREPFPSRPQHKYWTILMTDAIHR